MNPAAMTVFQLLASSHQEVSTRIYATDASAVALPWFQDPCLSSCPPPPDHRLSGQNHRHPVVGPRPVQACDVCAGFKAKRGSCRGRNASQRDRKDVVLSLLHNSNVKSGKCFLPILCTSSSVLGAALQSFTIC